MGASKLVGCHHHCPLVKPWEALHFSSNWFRLCGQWSWHSAFLLLVFSGSDLCSADVPPFFKGCYIHWSLVGFIFRTITANMEDGRVEAMGKNDEISIFGFSEVLNSTSFFFSPYKNVSCFLRIFWVNISHSCCKCWCKKEGAKEIWSIAQIRSEWPKELPLMFHPLSNWRPSEELLD